MVTEDIPRTIDGLFIYHERDMKALRTAIDSVIATQKLIMDTIQLALGIDVMDSTSVVRFHDEHQDLLNERNKLLRLQITGGRFIMTVCGGFVLYVLSKVIEMEFFLK